ncbi:hypothetical protein H6G41_11680 [Tolypothrix sp. FACHB-123]|uniref:hypothetical protein n=1 Tax=Tolypothrix sp. FACHB-123 TaxID=2692868 RepID=UPI0016874A02|nr:hypothetical protein [Tolypothrix sp. FACHB-123]MBD2355270.1 hypothetical protein [Tolypothrix sp. FACHB-123]
MTIVTSQEIAQFRSIFTENPTAMEVLDLIEDCEGDLEDAAMSLAIKAGQQPERANSEWLDALARKWRAVICEQEFRDELLNNSVQRMMDYLYTMPTFPKILAVPVVLYVLKQGVNNFCEPLDTLK